LFALEVAVASLWKSWGIQPDVVIGHSVGEFAAACVAGDWDLEAGFRLIAGRGRLMQSLPPGGAMAAVLAGEDRVRDAIRPFGSLAIAALNGPATTTISGPADDVAAALAALAHDGVPGER